MYIAVKGGEAAIEASRRLLEAARRGDPAWPELDTAQVQQQLGLLVDRVVAEGSLYDRELAALALRQTQGDTVEAAFLLRAYRNTLPRLAFAEPLDLQGLQPVRRVSAIFKDLPGGQLLGPTFDYTQRLLDFDLLANEPRKAGEADAGADADGDTSVDIELDADLDIDPGPPPPLPPALQGLVEAGAVEAALPSPGDPEPPDITRDPPAYPMPRTGWLQMLARADEGWLLGMAYSTQRGYAFTHPFAGELRVGTVAVELVPDELDFAVEVGDVEVTECQMLNQFVGGHGVPPQFTRGYGLVPGRSERKAMAMALVDRALRHDEFAEAATAPAQQQEFVLPHGDGVEASGFVQHLKLPHHVTFETEWQMLSALRQGPAAASPAGGAT